MTACNLRGPVHAPDPPALPASRLAAPRTPGLQLRHVSAMFFSLEGTAVAEFKGRCAAVLPQAGSDMHIPDQ
jgi:hypothetical protein